MKSQWDILLKGEIKNSSLKLDVPFYFGEMNTDDLVDLVFNFQAVGPDSGFENHGIHMLYFEDFEIKEKK